MKIVQFKDGNYAVRRWHLLLGYGFAGVDTGEASGYYWWSAKYTGHAKVATLSDAILRMEDIKQKKSGQFDIGQPVSAAEIERCCKF